jgi:SAM-dependent methyltransferase
MGDTSGMAQGYAYDPQFAEEHKRLQGMEALWDPGTKTLLGELGAGPGKRCLEAGAGGGSIVAWLAEQGAEVAAVDVDVRFVAPLASDRVSVHQLDLRSDPLPEGGFDFIHSRLVLEHLPERREVLERLVAALNPGGWIVIEDYDWSCFGFEGGDERLLGVADAVMAFMARAGFQADYGRHLVGDLDACGLADVRGEGRARVIGTDSSGYDFFRLSYESLKAPVVEAGLLTQAEADHASTEFESPDNRVLTPLMVAGIGRKA